MHFLGHLLTSPGPFLHCRDLFCLQKLRQDRSQYHLKLRMGSPVWISPLLTADVVTTALCSAVLCDSEDNAVWHCGHVAIRNRQTCRCCVDWPCCPADLYLTWPGHSLTGRDHNPGFLQLPATLPFGIHNIQEACSIYFKGWPKKGRKSRAWCWER